MMSQLGTSRGHPTALTSRVRIWMFYHYICSPLKYGFVCNWKLSFYTFILFNTGNAIRLCPYPTTKGMWNFQGSLKGNSIIRLKDPHRFFISEHVHTVTPLFNQILFAEAPSQLNLKIVLVFQLLNVDICTFCPRASFKWERLRTCYLGPGLSSARVN